MSMILIVRIQCRCLQYTCKKRTNLLLCPIGPALAGALGGIKQSRNSLATILVSFLVTNVTDTVDIPLSMTRLLMCAHHALQPIISSIACPHAMTLCICSHLRGIRGIFGWSNSSDLK